MRVQRQELRPPLLARVEVDRAILVGGAGLGQRDAQLERVGCLAIDVSVERDHFEAQGRVRKRARIVFTPALGKRIVTFRSAPDALPAAHLADAERGWRSLAPTCRPAGVASASPS